MDQDFQLEQEFIEMLDTVNKLCNQFGIECDDVTYESEDDSGADN